MKSRIYVFILSALFSIGLSPSLTLAAGIDLGAIGSMIRRIDKCTQMREEAEQQAKQKLDQCMENCPQNDEQCRLNCLSVYLQELTWANVGHKACMDDLKRQIRGDIGAESF